MAGKKPSGAAVKGRIDPKLLRFIQAYEEGRGASVRAAAEIAGCNKCTVYAAVKRNPAFRKMYRRAQRRAGRLSEDVLSDIANQGLPKFHDGKAVFEYFDKDGNYCERDELDETGKRKAVRKERVFEPSVTALIFKLKAAFPQRYREQHQVKVTGANGGPIQHTHEATEGVKRILADSVATDLANTLARRMALNAGGDGQSVN